MQPDSPYPETCAAIWRIDATKRRYRNSTPRMIWFSLLLGIAVVLSLALALYLLIGGLVTLGTISLLPFLVAIAGILLIFIVCVSAMRRIQVSVQSIFAKRGDFLYRITPGSKYYRIAACFVGVCYLLVLLNIQNAMVIWSKRIIGVASIILVILFVLKGLREVKHLAASASDINGLINHHLSKTIQISKVNQITENKQYYKVNCIFAQLEPNGLPVPQKAGNINISKDYCGVETLMQEFMVLQMSR